MFSYQPYTGFPPALRERFFFDEARPHKMNEDFYKIIDKLPPGTGCLCAAGSCCGFQMNPQTIQLLKQTETFINTGS